MPRKSASRNGAATEGTPARRSRSRKQAVVAAAGNSADHAGVTAPAIPHEEIERLAYFLWLNRGGQEGTPEDDWFRAEAELRRRYGSSEKSA